MAIFYAHIGDRDSGYPGSDSSSPLAYTGRGGGRRPSLHSAAWTLPPALRRTTPVFPGPGCIDALPPCLVNTEGSRAKVKMKGMGPCYVCVLSPFPLFSLQIFSLHCFIHPYLFLRKKGKSGQKHGKPLCRNGSLVSTFSPPCPLLCAAAGGSIVLGGAGRCTPFAK